MQSLVRLFLFTVARVALSLAIVLWFISNIWGVTGTGHILGASFRAVNCREGVAISGAQTITETWTIEYLTPEELDEASWVFAPSARDLTSFKYTNPLPGIGLLDGMGRVLISVTHWFLFVCAVLLYAILKLVYRKRTQQRAVPNLAEAATQ